MNEFGLVFRSQHAPPLKTAQNLWITVLTIDAPLHNVQRIAVVLQATITGCDGQSPEVMWAHHFNTAL